MYKNKSSRKTWTHASLKLRSRMYSKRFQRMERWKGMNIQYKDSLRNIAVEKSSSEHFTSTHCFPFITPKFSCTSPGLCMQPSRISFVVSRDSCYAIGSRCSYLKLLWTWVAPICQSLQHFARSDYTVLSFKISSDQVFPQTAQRRAVSHACRQQDLPSHSARIQSQAYSG